MLTSFLLILAGFVLLMGGAEYTVRGSVAIAARLKIPPMIIGLTIVALGTSTPELVVSLSAALKGSAGISVGNIVGSNIANILLILGVSALICPLTCKRSLFLRDFLFLLAVTAIFTFFILDGTLYHWQGIVLLILLFSFITYNYYSCRHGTCQEEVSSPLIDRSWPFIILITFLGFAAIIYGADLLVNGAIILARIMGVSEEIIGLTVIAFGTSLPELAASGMAAYRGHNDVALGNIIGSNIWNIVFIMGTTAAIVDVPVAVQIINYDIWIMFAATVLLFLAMYRKCCLSRQMGVIFILLYLAYIGSLLAFSRGYFPALIN